MKRDVRITEEEWLAELVRASMPNDPGYTREELEERWRCSDRVALKRIRAAIKAGCVVVGRKRFTRADTVESTKPTYRFVRKKGAP